jgi:hypothetical protein
MVTTRRPIAAEQRPHAALQALKATRRAGLVDSDVTFAPGEKRKLAAVATNPFDLGKSAKNQRSIDTAIAVPLPSGKHECICII